MPLLNPRRPYPLLGCAIGDALGAPFATLPFGSDELGAWLGTYQPHPPRCAGQGTDVTGITLALARTLVQNNGLYRENIRSHLTERIEDAYCGWDMNAQGGLDPNTYRALADMRAWDRQNGCASSARPCFGVHHALGHGALVRSVAIGAWGTHHRESIADWDTTITHDSSDARMASRAVAGLVKHLLHDPGPSIRSYVLMVAQALHYTAWFDPWSVDAYSLVNRYLEDNPRHVYETPLSVQLSKKLQSCPVEEVLSTALLILATASSFRDAVTCAVRTGGATHVRAALVGGIAACVWPIPEDWVEGVKNAKEIVQVNEALMRVYTP